MQYEKPCASAERLNRSFALQIVGFLIIMAMSFATVACAGFSSGKSSGQNGNNPVTISISPASPSVASGAQTQFTATVTNTNNTAVSWSATSGTITSSGLYTAPAVTTTQTTSVTATSLAILGVQASVNVTVTPSTTKLAITTTSLPGGTVGTTYLAALAGTGGTPPYAWTIASGSLPSGVQLSSGTGTLSGRTDTNGTYSFTAEITDASSSTATQSFQVTINSQTGTSCGPPTYSCSRTDSAIITATAPPQLGSNPSYYGGHLGAGVVAIDPAYNNRILRVTDGNTQTSRPGLSYEIGSSAEKSVTSYDESIFVVHSLSGQICFFQYNATSFSAQYEGCYTNMGTGGGDFGYTSVDQYAYYAYYQQKLYRFVIDPTTWTITADPTFNNGLGYFDPDNPNCLNGQIAANNWYTGDSALSSDDNTVITAVGPAQDADPYFVVWNRTLGCQWMNVQTYEVSQGWNTGLSNPTKITWASGTTPTQVGGIHNAQIDRGGTYGVLTINGVTSLDHKLFWTIGTNKVDDTCTSCTSHWACDFDICFWEMGPGTGYSLEQQAIGSLTPVLDVNTSAVQGQWGNDEHMSHANAESGQKMIYLASWQPGSGGSSVNQEWEDELVGINWDGSQRTIRFNKNWGSGYGGFNGSARCSISRQGNYAICDSDLQMYNLDKGFGNGLNQDTCDHTLAGGLISTNGCRSDVLLFELR